MKVGNHILMNRIQKKLLQLLATATALLAVCQGCEAACYPVIVQSSGRRVDPATNFERSYPNTITVLFGKGKAYSGGGYTQPPASYCGKLPATVEVIWRSFDAEGGELFRRTVPLAERLPSDFDKNPARGLIFRVDSNDQVVFRFRARLSDITEAKQLERAETSADVAQRMLDEALWLAISNKNVARVEEVLKAGADTKQPWMLRSGKDLGNFTQEYYNACLFVHALQSRNANIVELVLSYGAKLSGFTHTSIIGPFLNEGSYDIANVLIEHVKVGKDENHSPDLNEHTNTHSWREAVAGKSKTKERLLLIAVDNKCTRCVKLLIDNGATTNFQTSWGMPFGLWAEQNSTGEMRALLSSIGAAAQ